MEINTLVIHKKLKKIGIGCVSKILPKSAVRVNFGTDGVKICNVGQLELIDVSNCKTVNFSEYTTRIIKDNGTLNDVIVGNELKHYVGIGWLTTRVVTIDDLKKYPRVI